MCKKDYHIEQTAKYLYDILDEQTVFVPASKDLRDRIPLSVSSNFSFFDGILLGRQVLLAYTDDGDTTPPAQTKKLLDIINRVTGRIPILVVPKISSYNKTRLAAQKVNFIVPGMQMFLPSLLLEIKPERTIGADLKEAIPPFAQCLLLYHLQVAPITGANCKEISERFLVSYGTANIALRWLASRNLIRLTETKTKMIEVDLDKKALWLKALPMMTSPVERLYYTDATLDGQAESGINALSAYTMLNTEQRQCWAVSKSDVKALSIERDEQFGQNEIQVWKYNPKVLSKDGIVDRLSLYLSLKDDKDERVQMELERLISEMQW